VNLLYHATVVGLNPLQLVLVGTLLETVCFIGEIPTGIVADVYSRRLSILIGLVLTGIGFSVEGLFPTFGAVMLSQVIWGIGATFLSGAIEAWITDETSEDTVGHIFLRGTQIGLIATIAGVIGATGLGLISLQVPIVLGGVGFIVLAAMLAVVMPETWRPTARDHATSQFAHMRTTMQSGIELARKRPVVKMLIAISLFFGLSSEAFDRLQVKSIVDRFTFPEVLGTSDPVLWFGGAGLIGTLLSLIASEWFNRRNPESLAAGIPAKLLALLSGIQMVATLTFTLSGMLWLAFAMLWVRSIAGTLAGPVQSAWMHRNLESGARATVISLENQANAIGQVGGGPALGWVGNAVSIRAALLGSALLLMPIVGLYGRFRSGKATVPVR
jgi:DHA3 family tetracycline resistance protein-like MFS transporter